MSKLWGQSDPVSYKSYAKSGEHHQLRNSKKSDKTLFTVFFCFLVFFAGHNRESG